MIVKKELDLSTVAYLKDMLNFENFLCRCIQAYIGSGNTVLEAFTYLPEDINPQSIKNFKSGSVFSIPATYLSSYLASRCNELQNSGVIFDDVMASPSDKFLEGHSGTWFSWNDEIYHFVEGKGADEEVLSKIIWSTSVAWHFVCVILSSEERLSKEELSKNFSCELLRTCMKEVVIGAFDGEGFIHFVIRS